MSSLSQSTCIGSEPDAADERSQVQQIQFIEDQLKELEQRIKHVDTTIKQKISQIHYSERLLTYVNAQYEHENSALSFRALCYSFGLKNLPEQEFRNYHRGTIHNFESTEEDEILMDECVPTWQKTRFIENRMNCFEQEIHLLEDEKHHCEVELKNLKEEKERIYCEYHENFQVRVKNVR